MLNALGSVVREGIVVVLLLALIVVIVFGLRHAFYVQPKQDDKRLGPPRLPEADPQKDGE